LQFKVIIAIPKLIDKFAYLFCFAIKLKFDIMTLNYEMAVREQKRFHLSSSALVALLRKTLLSSKLAFAQNPRYKPIL